MSDFREKSGSDSGFLRTDAARMFLSEFRDNVKSALNEHRGDLSKIFESLNEFNKRIFFIEGELKLIKAELTPLIGSIKSELNNHEKNNEDKFGSFMSKHCDLKAQIDDMLIRLESIEKTEDRTKTKTNLLGNVFVIVGTILTLIFTAAQSGLFSFITKILKGG
jgi:uncharacterized protein YdcH (DUF465 family)